MHADAYTDKIIYFTSIFSDLALVTLSVEEVVLGNADVVPLKCSGAHRASLVHKIYICVYMYISRV